MRVCFFGTPNVAVPYLQALAEGGHDVCTAVTQPDRPAGRGKELRASAVKEAALSLGVPVLQPETCRCEVFAGELAGLDPEIGVVVAYGNLLTPPILGCAERGSLNVHYSLLPELRGGAPVQHALLRGMTETGVTIQRMVEKLDAGDVLLQERVAIDHEDDCAALFDRLNAVGPSLLIEALRLVGTGEARFMPQDASAVTWSQELSKDDCRVDWDAPADETRNQIRACAPRPGAFAFRGDRRLKILAAEVVADAEGQPGTIAEQTADGVPVVAAGSGGIALRTLQPEGKRAMSGVDYAWGARFDSGERLT